MTTAPPGLLRRPKAPGYAYGALALVSLLVIALVSATARQTPPPSIAEFAPQAVEQIREAPSEQSEGGGEATATGSSLTEGPAAEAQGTEAVIDVPRVRRCVGDPPRQTEDPQSPPCVAYFDGPNGEATSKGVSASQINIAYPIDGGHPLYKEYQFFETYFNKRFEFYGRKIRLFRVPLHFDCGPSFQQADAVKADEEANAFASVLYAGCSGYYYYEELARRRIVSAVNDPTYTTQFLREHRPYIWQYPMANERMFAAIGNWVCSRFGEGPASHSNDPFLGGTPRVYGIVLSREPDNRTVSTKPIKDELARCGITPKVTKEVDMNTEAFGPSTIPLQMRDAKVTSIICLCNYGEYGLMSRHATTQNYLPEWMVSSYFDNDVEGNLNVWGTKEQLHNTFGLTFTPRQQRPENEPSFWAEKEADPEAGGAESERYALQRLYRSWTYRSFLLLASGIQMAGPNLTPQTFGAGLQRARFPNPEHPIMAGKVGFNGDSFSMTLDAAEFWWSEQGRSPYADQQGTLCYVDAGARRTIGQWPKGQDPFFQGPCDSGG